jgi:hypothetical protein
MMIASNCHAERVVWVALLMLVLSLVHVAPLSHNSLRFRTHKTLLIPSTARSPLEMNR